MGGCGVLSDGRLTGGWAGTWCFEPELSYVLECWDRGGQSAIAGSIPELSRRSSWDREHQIDLLWDQC